MPDTPQSDPSAAPAGLNSNAELDGSRRNRYDGIGINFALEHPEFDTLATGTLNRAESEALLGTHFARYLAVMTPTFDAEGHYWLRNVVGNFDGAGASIGILQWNFKMNTVQPLLKTMAERHSEIWNKVFRDGRAEALLREMDKLGWITDNVNNGTRMKYEWAVDFDTLVVNREFQSIQIEFLTREDSYWDKAQQRARDWGFTSNLGLAAVFNASVQSGWFANDPDAIRVWEQQTGLVMGNQSFGAFLGKAQERVFVWNDHRKIELIRDVFAAQANPQWANDVRVRFDRLLQNPTLTSDRWE